MKNIKLIIVVLFLLLISLFFTGCSNYNELNNVMIVDGIGIEKQEDRYIISFNTYVGDEKYEIHTINSSNVNDAFKDIYLEVNKKIYLSHLDILVLSSNLDNSDIIDIINTLNSRKDLRGSFNVVLMDGYDSDIFSSTSLKIVEILNNNYLELGSIYPTTFNDVINDYLNMDISYIPILGNDLSITGMHSLFSEFRFYNILESTFLNILMGNSSNSSFTIDDEEVKINDIGVIYEINKNNITFNIDLEYTSILDKKDISNYLIDNINTLLDQNISYNYFKYLIKKYDYEYFKDYDNLSINFDIDISLSRDSSNNMKDGDLIEKD